MQEEQIKGIPLLSANHLKTMADVETALSSPIAVKVGEELGLMGEYNQAGESQQKLLHLEVFSYDDIEAFRTKAKGAYTQDKVAKRLTDNFLYIERGSQLYSIMDNKAYELGTTEVEVMLPLSEAQKVTIGQEKNKKDYYDVGAYLNNTSEKSEAKIYVDDTHLIHGVLFPGVNVFSQESNSLCIFNAELHEWCDPNSQLDQVEKDRLDPMFSAILAELDLDKDKPTEFKAGKLNQISLSPSQHRRMTGLIAKHDNEWKTTRIKDFEKMLALYRHHGKVEQASRLEKRIKDLAISVKVNYFDTEKQAYYMHPLGMVGWFIRDTKGVIDRDFFFSQYEKLFNNLTNTQKQALENIFTGIEEYIEADPSYICTLPKIAYMLATAKHETGHTFEPITEWGTRAYFNKYDPILANTPERRKKAISMENTKKGDGYKYRGRGYVMLTWHRNYRKSGEYLHKDLVNNPELALDQKNAIKIMIYGMETGMFTEIKMAHYISGKKSIISTQDV
ncbi:glycoside hydrolase, family 19 [Actinobacillus equuli]|uniref:glycoside hydrolase, family 19 n=1 Tax=Actinobacillus equuli TaxID=718 RepID=UPI0024415472|nr:glycoside hydrolase, family 19 [Actinobacillus equuli]WGE53804.1 glycoside hydrolase, family 19 [Actinobacillus equuli subsp. haemolyticus]WGE74245.1 glycoside hydrolase, family 19 [Actinobacillus equuli subsp. haemolyticus]